MKDLMMPMIYFAGAMVAVFGLIEIMSSEISSGMAIVIGLVVVVVLPVVLSIAIAKPDSEKEEQSK